MPVAHFFPMLLKGSKLEHSIDSSQKSLIFFMMIR